MSTKNDTNSTNGYAFLVGIRYAHWADILPPLNGTLKDIDALHNHFIDPSKAGFTPEHVTIIKEDQATASNILRSLDEFVRMVNRDPEASVIIYYSGHGETDGQKSFLVPYDFDLNLWLSDKVYPKDRVVLSQDFATKIADIQAKKVLIMLDCCHSENIPVGKGLEKHTAFLDRALNEMDASFNIESANNRTLLPNVKKGSGKVIFTSCEAHETSLDIESNGLFTSVLLECLNGSGNIEGDGWVRLIDIMRYVPREVKTRALRYDNHSQSPIFKRIENLKADEFIICAYDNVKTKSTQPVNHPSNTIGVQNTQKSLQYYIDLINEDLELAFKELDKLPWSDTYKSMYKGLKNKYISPGVGDSPELISSRLRVLLQNVIK